MLRNIFPKISAPNLLLGLDSNCKNKIWNSQVTDHKGLELEEVLLELDLTLLNRNLSELNCTPAGTAFVDLTVANGRLKSSIWIYPDRPSLSDHPFITYYVSMSPTSDTHRSNTFPKAPKLLRASKVNTSQFLAYTAEEIESLHPVSAPFTPETINDSISSLIEAISVSARRTLIRQTQVSGRNMPWWSPALCDFRSCAREAFKFCSVQKTPVNRATFSLAKATYQKELRRAKTLAWHSFSCKHQSGPDPFKALKLSSGKSASISLPPEITDSDTILNHAITHFSPRSPHRNLFTLQPRTRFRILWASILARLTIYRLSQLQNCGLQRGH